MVEVGATCSLAYRDLLEQINVVMQMPSQENKQRLAQLSKAVASSVSEIVQAAEALKGGHHLDMSIHCVAAPLPGWPLSWLPNLFNPAN